MFSEILETLSSPLLLLQQDSVSGDHLVGLSKVPRISALTMFMSEQDRARVGKIITEATADGKALAEPPEHIRKVFQL